MEHQALEIALAAGLSEKSARIYAAAAGKDGCSIAKLSLLSKVKRTTIYSLLAELEDSGAFEQRRVGKKTEWKAADPADFARLAQERILEAGIPGANPKMPRGSSLPRFSFLRGAAGFKKVWDEILHSREKEYRILTDASSFLDFAKEGYILQGIISKKKRLGVRSRQIILDSVYARKIVAKDAEENRQSRILPRGRGRLPFTEIILPGFVAFISPRSENSIFIIESSTFAETRHTAFEALWTSLKSS